MVFQVLVLISIPMYIMLLVLLLLMVRLNLGRFVLNSFLKSKGYTYNL
jgi:hypothetical protein